MWIWRIMANKIEPGDKQGEVEGALAERMEESAMPMLEERPEAAIDECIESAIRDDAFTRLFDKGGIRPYFQPIVDLHTAEVFSYEVLSRGTGVYISPVDMFAEAVRRGLVWDLECACQKAALETLAALNPDARTNTFFLNVSPGTLMDPRFMDCACMTMIRDKGLDPRQFTFEVTEADEIVDYKRFSDIMARLTSEGYQVALDDFGAGHSSMLTLVAASPQFLKLDRGIVSEIHNDSYKQHLLKAILSFTSSVDTKLIAEGVETIEELEALMRMGVRYVQGYLLGRPNPVLLGIAPAVKEQIRRLTRRFHYPRISLMPSIAGMILRPPAFEAGAMTCEELDRFFGRTPSADHVVLLEQGKPSGLISRQHFGSLTGGRFGFTLVQNKDISCAAKRNCLTFEEGIDITVLSRLAMERDPEDMYDPLVIVGAGGEFLGTITMKQLLIHSSRIQLQLATNANPLTGLPGNTMIDIWIQSALQSGVYSIIYADLDRFKEYNDSYGFPRGDDMIQTAARVLNEKARVLSEDACTGHIGGDDFVIVTPAIVDEAGLDLICRSFDREKLALFNKSDAELGHYRTVDRQGMAMDVPIVTLSLAVVTSENLGPSPCMGRFGEVAAALKKEVKRFNAQQGRSGYRLDRRLFRDM